MVPPAHRLDDSAEQALAKLAAKAGKAGPVDRDGARQVELQKIHGRRRQAPVAGGP